LNAIRWTLLRVLHCCNAAVCAAQSLLTQVDRNQMTNNALHVRLRYLRNAEAFLALALPGVLAFHWWGSGETVDWALRLPPAVLVGLMLLQGAHYWHLKLVSMRSREPLPAYFRPLYHSFRAADLIALIVMTIWLAVMALRGAAKTDLAWAAAILAFAVLEFVNYFGLQLMHDTAADFNYPRRHRRLRRAALATDLGRLPGRT
jgi:signal transduction histidine kinase